MQNLANLGGEITTQSAQFNDFLDQLTAIEVSEKKHLETVFRTASEEMPLFKKQIMNLWLNLASLEKVKQRSTTGFYRKAS